MDHFEVPIIPWFVPWEAGFFLDEMNRVFSPEKVSVLIEDVFVLNSSVMFGVTYSEDFPALWHYWKSKWDKCKEDDTLVPIFWTWYFFVAHHSCYDLAQVDCYHRVWESYTTIAFFLVFNVPFLEDFVSLGDPEMTLTQLFSAENEPTQTE